MKTYKISKSIYLYIIILIIISIGLCIFFIYYQIEKSFDSQILVDKNNTFKSLIDSQQMIQLQNKKDIYYVFQHENNFYELKVAFIKPSHEANLFIVDFIYSDVAKYFVPGTIIPSKTVYGNHSFIEAVFH